MRESLILLIRRCACRLLGLCLLLATLPAAAADALHATLADVRGPDWSASDIRVELPLQQPLTARLVIGRLQLPAPLGELGPLRLECGRAEVSAAVIACEDAEATLSQRWLADAPFKLDLRYRRASQRLDFTIRRLALAAGPVDVSGHWQPDGWRLRLLGSGLDAARLKPLLTELARLPADLDLQGRLTLRLDLSRGAHALTGDLDLHAAALSLQNASGSLASEALDADLAGRFQQSGNGWAFQGSLLAPAGQFYAEPVFVDAGRHPLRMQFEGRQDGDRLTLDALKFEQPSAFIATGRLGLSLQGKPRLDALELAVFRAPLAGFYPLYLQPFLIGTPLDDLQAEGNLSGELSLQDGQPQRLSLRLDAVGLHDGEHQRFGLNGIDGELHWARTGAAQPSTLAWRDGHLFKLGLGPARVPLRLQGADLELLAPARLPILDGALVVDTLRIQRLGSADLALAFDAALEPIALGPLSTALGWPAFAGTLAGRVPSLTYQDGILSMGGALQVSAFDGDITVQNLRVADPLGAVPRLAADITLRGLDLKTLTDTFSFGRVEGRLDGDISDLRLVNWRPEAFDARFYTPAGDRSRRRISQRAIQNLSEIGGGAGAVLSRGFLRVFQDFGYRRIGLSCRLSGDECQMGGIAPAADGGYYIVRGGGLPRIDVIGHTRAVSWPTLLEQLKSATESEGPVVR